MNLTIDDLALDLGIFALDNEIEDDGTRATDMEKCNVAA